MLHYRDVSKNAENTEEYYYVSDNRGGRAAEVKLPPTNAKQEFCLEECPAYSSGVRDVEFNLEECPAYNPSDRDVDWEGVADDRMMSLDVHSTRPGDGDREGVAGYTSGLYEPIKF